ncbi:hypothetical protein G6F46_008371 [Rhizopus delemar]|nr:hypothetical protein G6F55_007404 [Rhizopus delemar]KAG1534355.1 hypothetical protein G6F51_012138 [Rhizopus arrhizus]KAG1488785.1 hypothetical protein G6F54_011883 [Rhizopus delemar]KAG1497704.1 hypothetical protein G6F53_011908 [Rhizopus delemar]KAG1510753.1 hypothetical protein G6F52_010820 [Rhizopus delemar]
MDRVAELINQQKHDELFQYCQQLEFQSVVDANVDMSTVYPIYLASCLLKDDIQSARYIRKRIKSQGLHTTEIDAIWSVIVAYIQKSYSNMYSCIDNYSWSDLMQVLVGRIKENMRNQMLILIPNVYTSIELNQAAEFFGLQENELLPELMNRGWKYDANTKILCPMKPGSFNSSLTNDYQISKLADIVIQLEKF